MVVLQGGNGQSPVFYNPLMIACAWAVITRIDLLRQGRIDAALIAGFAAAGLAIAFKQSALFEGAYFGLAALWLMTRSNAPVATIVRNGLVLAAVGMLPMAITALFYLVIGHFEELWWALVGSVFGREYGVGARRYLHLSVIAPLAAFAFIGILRARDANPEHQSAALIWGWIAAALLAIAIFPAIYIHYTQSLVAPLCLGALPFYRELRFRAPVAIATCLAMVVISGEWNPRERLRSRAQSQQLVDYLHSIDMPRELLIWGFPSYLYVLADKAPPSRLASPPHLFDKLESGSSGIDEGEEIRRILARKPSVVVLQRPAPLAPQNRRTEPLVLRYVENCPTLRKFVTHDHLVKQTQFVYSDCPP